MKSISAKDFLELLTAYNHASAPHSFVHIFDSRPNDLDAPLAYAKPLTLADVQSGIYPDTAKSTTIYLVCERGHISELVGLYLELAGFSEVYNLAGGLKALESLANGWNCIS